MTDPSLSYCRLTLSFDEDETLPSSLATSFRNENHRVFSNIDSDEGIDDLISGFDIQEGLHLKEGTIFATFIEDVEYYNVIQQLRDLYGQMPAAFRNRARDAIDPVHRLTEQFPNRAAPKLISIDCFYPLRDRWLPSHLDSKDHVYYANVADGPGSFVNYLQSRYPNGHGYGMTLKASNDWNTRYVDMKRFSAYYGEDGKGDLFTSYNDFVTYIQRELTRLHQFSQTDDPEAVSRFIDNDGLDFVVGDGKYELDEYLNREELVNMPLFLTQILVGITTLRRGGAMVIKCFDLVTALSGDILYLLSMLFREIALFKPCSSRAGNSEKYLILRNFDPMPNMRDGAENILGALFDEYFQPNLFPSSSEKVPSLPSRLFQFDLPKDFTNWMKSMNQIFFREQLEGLTMVMNLINDFTPSTPEEEIASTLAKAVPQNYDLTRLPILWNVNFRIGAPETRVLPYGGYTGKISMEAALRLYYPYLRYRLPRRAIEKTFSTLKKYALRLVEIDALKTGNQYKNYTFSAVRKYPNIRLDLSTKIRGNYRIVLSYGSPQRESIRYSELSTVFSEEGSINLRFDTYPSDYQYWKDFYSDIIKEATGQGAYNTSIEALRNVILSKATRVTILPIELMAGLINLFNPASILDLTPNLGEGYLAALATETCYAALDGSPALKKIMDALHDFGWSNSKKMTMEMKYPETMTLEGTYDLIFFAPLANLGFEQEGYLSSFQRCSSWLSEYFFAVLKKSLFTLKSGGHLVLLLEDFSIGRLNFSAAQIVNEITSHFSSILRFNGAVGYNHPYAGKGMSEKMSPVWIWEKLPIVRLMLPLRTLPESLPSSSATPNYIVYNDDEKYPFGTIERINKEWLDGYLSRIPGAATVSRLLIMGETKDAALYALGRAAAIRGLEVILFGIGKAFFAQAKDLLSLPKVSGILENSRESALDKISQMIATARSENKVAISLDLTDVNVRNLGRKNLLDNLNADTKLFADLQATASPTLWLGSHNPDIVLVFYHLLRIRSSPVKLQLVQTSSHLSDELVSLDIPRVVAPSTSLSSAPFFTLVPEEIQVWSYVNQNTKAGDVYWNSM